jgi:protein-L-isoaspartate(D-aspartate) O-methyltransferase
MTTIAVTGCFQNGKSTFINCLLDDYVAQTGWGDSTTHISTVYKRGEIQTVKLYTRNGKKFEDMYLHEFLAIDGRGRRNEYIGAEIEIWKPILANFNIIDTPGFDANAEDEKRAIESLNGSNFAIFVASNQKGLSETEKSVLQRIASLKIPYIIILNCVSHERWEPFSRANDSLNREINAMLQMYGHMPEFVDGKTPIWPCNLLWFWHSTSHYSENPENWQKNKRMIKKYFKIEGRQLPNQRMIAEKSNFLPIRRFLENRLKKRQSYEIKDIFNILENEESISKSEIEKLELSNLVKLASADNPVAEFVLGKYYHHGNNRIGIERDLIKAFKWYKRAAGQSYKEAAAALKSLDREWPRSSAQSRMVQKQLKDRDITDEKVLQVMGIIPRHEFVPSANQSKAYEDNPILIEADQTVSQPYMVAIMSELLNVKWGEKVLEIGTGAGYQAAILSGLTDKVYSIEIISKLASAAKERLERLKFDEIIIKEGDGYFGWDEYAPYDAIILTTCPNHIPPSLFTQLRIGGRMLLPLGQEKSEDQNLVLITKESDTEYVEEELGGVQFNLMQGKSCTG